MPSREKPASRLPSGLKVTLLYFMRLKRMIASLLTKSFIGGARQASGLRPAASHRYWLPSAPALARNLPSGLAASLTKG